MAASARASIREMRSARTIRDARPGCAASPRATYCRGSGQDPPKDFSDARLNAGWTDEPLTWHEVRRDGHANIIAVTDHAETVVTLVLTPLPEYCPGCEANVGPFWGVT